MRKFNLLKFLLIALLIGANAEGVTNMTTANDIIEKLGLQPLPQEGGYYRETFRSDDRTNAISSDGRQGPSRNMSTAIYYLVTPESFSAIHRITSDEVFHFYGGDPVEMIQITDDGEVRRYVLGSDIFNDESPQVVVPKGVWQGLRLIGNGQWALMGTTVAPGFDFDDFEIGDRKTMMNLFPHLGPDIEKFTRE